MDGSTGFPFAEVAGPVELHPALAEMDKEQVAVLAAIGRVPGTEQFTDEQLASILLRLQEEGLITLGADESYEPFIQLNLEPEKGRAEYQARQSRGPSRRERRAKRRGKKQ